MTLSSFLILWALLAIPMLFLFLALCSVNGRDD